VTAGRSRQGKGTLKKSEKQAKERLRNHPAIADIDHVAVVTKKGARLEYNQGQAVKQGFGSGLRDILGSRKKK
jgi:hypothetical protein